MKTKNNELQMTYDYYCENILTVLSKYFDFFWIQPRNLKEIDNIYDSKKEKLNPYLNKYDSDELLKNISEQGMLFPIFVFENENKELITICGRHRVSCFQKDNELKNNYILAIKPKNRYRNVSQMSVELNQQKILEEIVIPKELEESYKEFYEKNGKFNIVNDVFVLRPTSKLDLIDLYTRYPKKNNKKLFETTVTGHPSINNYVYSDKLFDVNVVININIGDENEIIYL